MNDKKVVPLEDRLPQLKKERKRKANRRFIFYATLFFLLILIVVFFQSPFSRIRDLSVKGEQLTETDQVIEQSRLSTDTHIWDIRPDETEKRIEELPTVQAATVRLSFPNRVLIFIEEYKREAYLFKDNGYYPILENGATLDRLPEGKHPVDAPVLFGFSDRKSLSVVAGGLGRIPQEIIHSISDIHYISKADADNNLMIYMNDGNRVLASTATFEKNIVRYPEIAASLQKSGQKGTVHLSVGSYFIPDESENQGKNEEKDEP